MHRLPLLLSLLASLCFASACLAQAPATTTAPALPAGGKLPHVSVDVPRRQVRVECEALAVDAPLEFFCVKAGTSEHESVLRTPALPSHVHLGLLMLGLEPGRPVHYSEAAQKWLPPHGPPLRITLEYEKDGKIVSAPATRWMRDIRSGEEMPATHWIFAGSRVMEDGNYAADVTGYVVSVVNFDLTVIDIPKLASNSNETLDWQRNPDVAAPAGTKVIMILEPVADGAGAQPAPADEQSAPTTGPSAMSEAVADEKLIADLRQRWEQAVLPHGAELRDAAQTHYEVLAGLRREQQRLIDEADKLQRLIEELEKRYQDLTTPRPEPAAP